MNKEWINPEVKNLIVERTKEEVEECDPTNEKLIGGLFGTCKVWDCVHRAKEEYKGYCYCHRELGNSGNNDNGTDQLPQS